MKTMGIKRGASCQNPRSLYNDLAIQQIVNLWAIYIYVVENCFWHMKSENYINQLLHSTKAKHEKKTKKKHTFAA
jgi:hypothetical protein